MTAVRSFPVIVDDIGRVVERMRTKERGTSKEHTTLDPHYLYGHRLEIRNILAEKEKDKVYKYQKYPLVALRLDTPETVLDDVIAYKLNIVILTRTKDNYKASERFDKVIKPTLYPLYESFMKELGNVGRFFWKGEFPQHTKIDRPLWGIESAEANTEYIFSDALDGIEIIDLVVRQKIRCKP